MSFYLWPDSIGAENSTYSDAGRETRVSTPALDFIQVLHSAELEVSAYRDLVDDFLHGPATVGSGGQAVVELSRRPGVVIKRLRRFRYGDSNRNTRTNDNLARVMLELRILKAVSPVAPYRNGSYIAKLADFGLSVHLCATDFPERPERDVYFPPGTLILNAPEVRNRVLSSRSVDIAVAIRADVFSFGLLLWEVINNGQSYFNMAWLDTAQAPEMDLGTEEQMTFLSNLPFNGLLMRGEEFLSVRGLGGGLHEQILQAFHASLQDDHLQRQPMVKVWEILVAPAKKPRSDQKSTIPQYDTDASS
ncbi:MAG: hypothetical protein Q9191_005076 [Dirinaria sp. TL-2023a]